MIASRDSRDIFTLKGGKALGRDFYVPMQHDTYIPAATFGTYGGTRDQIDIVATEDNTTVTFVPKGDFIINGATTAAGTVVTRTMHKGQTLKIVEASMNCYPTLAGTHIYSDKDIAVTVIEDLVGGDTSGDQIVPVSSLGTLYVVPKGYMNATRATWERVYVVATESGTNLKINGSTVASGMAPGDVHLYVFPTTDSIAVMEANNPVYVYQRTGFNEQGSAILPSIYAVNRKRTTFYATNATEERIFLVYMSGFENEFTITINGVTSSLNLTNYTSVPGIPGWSFARNDLSSLNISDKVVTIANAESPFMLGYIAANPGTGTMTCYGNFSTYANQFTFDEDTVWFCHGSQATLSAGFASSYDWLLPDGTHRYTDTIHARQSGLYRLTVGYDLEESTDSLWVIERFFGSSIIVSNPTNIPDHGSGTRTYSVQIPDQSADYIKYEWSINGSATLATSPTFTHSWDWDDEAILSVLLTDTIVGCTRTLQFVHHKYPDNVVNSDCYLPAKSIDFSMQLLTATTTGDLDVITTPLIGDIDNDGEIEILHPDRLDGGGNSVQNSTTELRIYGVKITAPASPASPQLYLKYSIPLTYSEFMASGTTLTPSKYCNNTFYTFAKVDPPNATTGKRYAAIFLATISGKLYKYEFNPSTNQYVATHSVIFNPYNYHYIGARPVLSDLMGDGHVQVCILDKIYDAQTLTLLATLRDENDNPVVAANNTLSSYSFGFISHGVEYWGDNVYSEPSLVVSIDDIDEDGKKEIIAGDCVYKVNLTNWSGEAGNSYRLAVRANKSDDLTTDIEARTDIWDGCGVVIDLDLDGKKDVVVASRKAMSANIGYLYAYDPTTGKVKNTTVTSFTRPGAWHGGPSFPFIGDIDHDNLPEVCFGANVNDLYAFKYDTIAKLFYQFWKTSTSDNTGCIGLSLFDFEQDGEPEIVYRDNNHLYIWDGSTSPPTSVNPPLTGNLLSASAAEYPVIADVNGDGAADIIVTGGSSGSGFSGNIRIYTAQHEPWAPARSVWHMSPAHPLYINDDLTIPSYPISTATRFPGNNHNLGDSDDVWPYNNFMQQQSVLSLDGTPLWTLPRPFIDSTFFYYDALYDTMYVTVDVVNTGDAPFNSPFYITTYKDSVGSSVKYTYTYNGQIHNGDTVRIDYRFPNFLAAWSDLTSVVVRVNDAGNGYSAQTVCDSTAGSYTENSRLLAFADYYSTVTNTTFRFKPIENDTVINIPTFSWDVVYGPLHGNVVIYPNDSVEYTPDRNYYGSDTLYYLLKTADNRFSSFAPVYITIQRPPDIVNDTATCYAEPDPFAWGIQQYYESDVFVHDYCIPVGGDIDGDGLAEILAAKENPSIEQQFNSIYIFPGNDRYNPEEMSLNYDAYTSCHITLARVNISGVTTPIAVVVGIDQYLYAYNLTTRTLLWKSDVIVEFTTTSEYGTCASYYSVNVGVTDFDGDGLQEIYAGRQVFAAENGKMLAIGDGNKGCTKNICTGTFRHSSIAADVLQEDGIVELIAGTHIYTVNVSANRLGTGGGNSIVIADSIPCVEILDFGTVRDGETVVADIDRDGKLDVIVTNGDNSGVGAHKYSIVIYNPRTKAVMAAVSHANAFNGGAHSLPFIANVDNEPNIEVFMVRVNNIDGWRYNAATGAFTQIYSAGNSDASGSTGITMFDFNNDGKAELVYRDMTHIRIMEANPSMGTLDNLASFPCTSGTIYEYPIILDTDNEKSSAIVATGNRSGTGRAKLYIYKSDGHPWSPSRPVWNQYSYNIVNINGDLTVPELYFNPAQKFRGADGVLYTADDVQPMNGFLMQQTTLDSLGIPIWLLPDGLFRKASTSLTLTGDSATIQVCIYNQGNAAFIPPVYLSVYKDDAIPSKFLLSDTINRIIRAGDTVCHNIPVPDISTLLPFTRLVVRLNDDGNVFTHQQECDDSDSIIWRLNPEMSRMLKKRASLNGVSNSGVYSNPVAVLFGENIEYEISGYNTNNQTGAISVYDTLPMYLNYAPGSSSIPLVNDPPLTVGSPSRQALEWNIGAVGAAAPFSLTFKATPQSGSAASQPLYINQAHSKTYPAFMEGAPISVMSDSATYHQGAGVAIVSFAASVGGVIFAEPQAVDYSTTVRASSLLVVPDSGYVFAGWSHPAYVSLRGQVIPATKGVLNLDTLLIYGNVELTAEFEDENLNRVQNLVKGEEVVEVDENTAPVVWSSGAAILVKPVSVPAVLRIYTSEGVLVKQQTLLNKEITTIKMPAGVYIATLNNSVGVKLRINNYW
jgi:hypothetical protein